MKGSESFLSALYLTGRQKNYIIYFQWATFLKEKSFEDVPKQGLIRFNWRQFMWDLFLSFFSSLVKVQIVIDY